MPALDDYVIDHSFILYKDYFQLKACKWKMIYIFWVAVPHWL